MAIARSAALLALPFLLPAPLVAQVDAFQYDSSRVPVGRRYEFIKSNRDGTHPGNVSLFVAARDRIESLKWSPGDTVAVLVVARLDWTRFSVSRLESWLLSRSTPPVIRATLDAEPDGSGVRLSFQRDSLIRIAHWPWHSYDFDFASLNLALAHLRNPEAGFTFGRADITYNDNGPPFADFGAVQVRYLRREERRGQQTRVYQLNGPGLQDRPGLFWVAAQGAYLVEYEFPFPDEPGYRDVRLVLKEATTLTPEQWEAYKRRRVSGEK